MEWAVRGGSDYLIGETFNDLREARLALDVMKRHGHGKKTLEALPCSDSTANVILIVNIFIALFCCCKKQTTATKPFKKNASS